MPRYVSKYRGYEFVAIHRVDQEIHWQTGKRKHPGITCKFRHAGLSPWEKQAALDRFKFGGLGHDEDATRRLSYYDTDLEAMLNKWTPEDKEEVEARLESAPGNGVDFIRVDKPAPALPYASYAKHRVLQGRRTVEHVVADVQRAAEVAGVDLASVLAYEREVGGQSELLAALERLAPSGPDATEELVEA